MKNLGLYLCRWMLWATQYELAIAEKFSSNLHYIQRVRDDVRHWEKEVKLAEVNRG